MQNEKMSHTLDLKVTNHITTHFSG